MKNFQSPGIMPLLLVIISTVACNPEMIPLKGKYMNNPSEITLGKPGDSVWLKISDLFAQKGLGVKSIDKNKGLIVTEKTSLISAYTYENKEGQLEDPDGWVVLNRIINKKKEWVPKVIYSRWTIQITEVDKGTTLVKVDPVVVCNFYPGTFISAEIRGQSTGVLEELIKSSVINDSKVTVGGR